MSRDPIGEQGGLNLYGFVSNTAINKVDYLGLLSSIDEAFKACLSKPTTYLQIKCMEDFFDTIGGDGKFEKVAEITACELVHAAYDKLNCKGCKKKCYTKEEARKRSKCFIKEIGLRYLYLKMKCDYKLPGSISRPGGSAEAERGHKKELRTKIKGEINCFNKYKSLYKGEIYSN